MKKEKGKTAMDNFQKQQEDRKPKPSINRQEEIQESDDKVGRYGCEGLKQNPEIIYQILYESEDEIPYKDFILKDVQTQHRPFDLISVDRNGSEQLHEVKTSRYKLDRNFVVEIQAKNDKGDGYIPGWYQRREAAYFHFVTLDTKNGILQVLSVNTPDQVRFVDLRGDPDGKTDWRYRLREMNGDLCFLLPIWGGNGIVKWLKENASGKWQIMTTEHSKLSIQADWRGYKRHDGKGKIGSGIPG